MSNTRRSALIDRQDIVQWRRRYLLQIKDFRRQGRPIYYQDETWINAGHTLGKMCVDQNIQTSRQAFLEGYTTGLKKPTSKERRLIISHLGNEDGFVEHGLLMFESKPGKEDYHSDMNAQCFEEWLIGILPKLKPNAVLVIDNAPYHSRRVEVFPSMRWTKQKIIEWVQNKNIAYPEKATKSDLIALSEPFREACEKYEVKNLAIVHGVTILRLPPYHCELNAIELIWAQAKGHVARNNKTFNINDVKNLFLEGLEKIIAEKWKDCINNVIKIEDKMMELDHISDSVSDRFIIELRNDEDDDEEISDIDHSDDE